MTMTFQFTCPHCASSVEVVPTENATHAQCTICSHELPIEFKKEQIQDGVLKVCPCCQRMDFYQQKDFNRKIGVVLFVIASILAFFTYGISLIVLYLMDLLLFKKLKSIVVCYKCLAIARGVKNLHEIPFFDHETNDRIVYSDHQFYGKGAGH